MTKKFLLHFNVLYLGVLLSLIILPSLAWSQVFDDPVEDTSEQEVAVQEESEQEVVQEEVFVNPLDQVEEENLPQEIGGEILVPENEDVPFVEEPLSNEAAENQEILPEEPVVEEPVVEEPVVEEPVVEEPVVEEPVVEEPVVEKALPTLTVRRFEKNIFLDKEARHSCEAEQFRIDVSRDEFTRGEIFLNKNLDIGHEVEVGSLPDGIDLKFSNNNNYLYQPGSSEDTLDFDIVVQEGAQRGNFTVPFIYTQKGLVDSSVICQLNIINL